MGHSDKMAYFMTNLCRMLFLVLCISSFGVYAQAPSLSTSTFQSRQSNRVARSRPAVTQRLEDIRQRTAPGYYAKVLIARTTREKSNGFALRTTETCDITCTSGPLPVTLISFEAARIDAMQVLLKWETSSETNNAGFEIERSAADAINFEKVGFVDGQGNSFHTKKYDLHDPNSSDAITYYRLKQADVDGKFEYSRIVAVQGYKELLTVIALPNPGSQSNTLFEVKGNDKSGTVEFVVMNVKGLVVYRNKSLKLAGDKRIALSQVAPLGAGLYIGKVISGDQHATVSFAISN